MKRILVQMSRYLWWPLFILQGAAGGGCLYLYFYNISMWGAAGCLVGAFLFYLARVWLKGINVDQFEKYYNVDQEIAPGMEGSKRRNLRRKNKRDEELKDIADGIL